MKLEFGTAGIRGVVGNDINNLNEAHAASIFEAYAKYINDNFVDKEKIVVIGRDNRIKGKQFSIIAANILTSYGIKVYFNNQMLATPFISFLIKNKKAIGGINITASHNPKEYNGIKLYNKFGYQMLPDEISKIKRYLEKYENYQHYLNSNVELNQSNLILNIDDNDYENYVNKILELNLQNIDLSNIKIVYSPLHGTGYKYVKKIFDKLNVDVIYQQNEIVEDENFTYVENPNPEYEIAYKNCIKLAQKENADLILITDPDSDRIGVSFVDDKQFKFINGNENAILITDYLLNNKKNESRNKQFLIYSFVSTSLPSQMCKQNGIDSFVTETGFKWIGQKIEQLKDQNRNLFFAFEESYGSLIDDSISLDKDAIQGVLLITIIASLAKKENLNLGDKLEQIYSKYGFMKAKSFSFDLKDKDQLDIIKNKFKNINFDSANFLDYSKGIRNIESNDMLSYEFIDSLNWVSLRPSGTEPKFKIYIHVVEKTKIDSDNKFEQLYQIIKDKLNL
ncbi:MAG: phospho-sugar mutase [Mycoplasmataceae bacterium]|nr:phospho-sugar mutase [Mycoplasmataceae bacterium]